MASPRRTSSARRSATPSGRRRLALGLLAGALPVTVVAVWFGSLVGLLGVALAVILVASGAALLVEETVTLRREAAREHATQAREQTRAATAKAREHIAFADHMASRVRAGRVEIERLLADLTTSATALAEAERACADAVRRERTVAAELADTKRALERTRRELRHTHDALTASQAAELQARSELLAAQETDASRRLA